MPNPTGFSILLFLIGLVIGIIAVLIFNYLKKNSALKEAEDILNKANSDVEKLKKDTLAEAKEEIKQLKETTDKEIKEKKD